MTTNLNILSYQKQNLTLHQEIQYKYIRINLLTDSSLKVSESEFSSFTIYEFNNLYKYSQGQLSDETLLNGPMIIEASDIKIEGSLSGNFSVEFDF